MSKIEIHQFAYNNDNYGVLVHDAASGETVAIDAGDAGAYQKALSETGWQLSQIWITHHHWDHVDGLAALKGSTGARVFGPKDSAKEIKGIDVHVAEGDLLKLGDTGASIIHTPGHTLDMLNFYFEEQQILFSGDTLFALGCGRLFEGTPKDMWRSLQKLLALPDETTIYCAHEYTAANADFAMSVDPDNQVLIKRVQQITELRNNGKPTVPTNMGIERATNPFLRPDDLAIRELLGMIAATDEAVFTEIRARKDRF